MIAVYFIGAAACLCVGGILLAIAVAEHRERGEYRRREEARRSYISSRELVP